MYIPALLRNYDRPTDRQTNRPGNRMIFLVGTMHSRRSSSSFGSFLAFLQDDLKCYVQITNAYIKHFDICMCTSTYMYVNLWLINNNIHLWTKKKHLDHMWRTNLQQCSGSLKPTLSLTYPNL